MTTAAARPHLTAVPNLPTAPLEGVVIEKAAAVEKARPSRMAAAKDHVVHHRGYLPWAARGYRRTAATWIDRYHDDWPLMIEAARAELPTVKDAIERAELKALVKKHRADYRRHRLIWTGITSAGILPGAAGAAIAGLTGGLWIDALLGIGAYLYGVRKGHSEQETQELTAAAQAQLDGGRQEIRGEQDLITALIKAKIITEAQRSETRTIGQIRPDGPGWTATIELPEGMEAVEATSKGGKLAGALRVKAQQIQLKPDTSDGSHEGRVVLWVADSPNPFGVPKVYSELLNAERWHFWRDGVPLGSNARRGRHTLNLIWSSILIGGLQDYGKSYLARLIAAAAALDPTMRIIVITGKSGPDWAPLKAIAHRWISGSEPGDIREVLELMSDTISDMQKRGRDLARLFEENPERCPEGKITPELAADGMGPVLLIVDELQELLDGAALVKVAAEGDDSDNPRLVSAQPILVDYFARFVRVARFVLGMGVFVTQRPDADSVPTELRAVCIKRASFRTKDPDSSGMVLGKAAVKAGAAPHALTEKSKGVFVLDEGAEDGYTTLTGDVIDLPDFRKICERGRQLRIDAGTLTGDAAERAERDRRATQARLLSADCLAVMDAAGTDRIRTEDLLAALGQHDFGSYGRMTAEGLKELLAGAGLGSPVSLGAMGELKNPRGFKREIFARYE